MKEEKNYIIELHAVGKKKTSGYAGRDEVCAHFSTSAKVGTITFERAKMDAVDRYWNQNKRWWLDYRIGKLKVQTGSEPVSVMSAGWEYHKGRTLPVYEEVN